MINKLMERIAQGEAVNITFKKKDGSTAHARVIEGPTYDAKTNRVKVEAPEGMARLFCDQRGRWITVQVDTVVF